MRRCRGVGARVLRGWGSSRGFGAEDGAAGAEADDGAEEDGEADHQFRVGRGHRCVYAQDEGGGGDAAHEDGGERVAEAGPEEAQDRAHRRGAEEVVGEEGEDVGLVAVVIDLVAAADEEREQDEDREYAGEEEPDQGAAADALGDGAGLQGIGRLWRGGFGGLAATREISDAEGQEQAEDRERDDLRDEGMGVHPGRQIHTRKMMWGVG